MSRANYKKVEPFSTKPQNMEAVLVTQIKEGFYNHDFDELWKSNKPTVLTCIISGLTVCC